ncbi:MAG: transposase [Gammaproteobacteria bacterium]|nr:transposase [Gammaproteobacteria bacterium]
MARLPRVCIPGIPLHIIQRGNNRQACFASEKDVAAYARWLEEYAAKNTVAIHAWVFMTNHVHLLVTPVSADGVPRLMQTLGRQYVRYFNHANQRTGTLWEGRYKSCVVETDSYLLVCQRYIELNPVRAGMVATPEDYSWSSYRANALGHPAKLWTPHPAYQTLGTTVAERADTYRRLFPSELEPAVTKAIRDATNSGMALGNDRFRDEIERLSGRRMIPLKRGPKTRRARR